MITLLGIFVCAAHSEIPFRHSIHKRISSIYWGETNPCKLFPIQGPYASIDCIYEKTQCYQYHV